MKFIDKFLAKFKRPSPEVAQSIEPAERSGEAGEEENGRPQASSNLGTGESKLAEACPYCKSGDFVKRGKRKKKLEDVQLYICRNPECGRVFTAQFVTGKHFPLKVIIEAMSYYNLGLTLEQTCSVIRQKFGAAPDPETLSAWLEQDKEL